MIYDAAILEPDTSAQYTAFDSSAQSTAFEQNGQSELERFVSLLCMSCFVLISVRSDNVGPDTHGYRLTYVSIYALA